MRFKELVFIVIITFLFSGCKHNNGHSEIIIPKISEFIVFGEGKELKVQSNITGTFVSEDLKNKNKGTDKVVVSLSKICDGKLQLKVRSIKTKEKPSFSFETVAQKKNDSLYTTILNGKRILLIINNNKLSIKPEKPEDFEVLTICWFWGTSLEGNYKKIKGSLGVR